jgi:hypothetical protein
MTGRGRSFNRAGGLQPNVRRGRAVLVLLAYGNSNTGRFTTTTTRGQPPVALRAGGLV